MGIINNQGVFIAPPLGPGDATTLTSFREDDDFSTEIFDESIVLPSLPNNVGIAFIKSSDSPADFATIALNGTNTSTVYVENTAGSVDLAVSNDVYVGYKATPSGISSTGITGNLYVNGFIFGGFQDIRLRGRTRFGLNTIEIDEADNSITGVNSITASVGVITSMLNVNGSLIVSGVSTFGPIYQESTGKIIGPGNLLNSPSNASISIDLSQSMVSIGTIGREPIWNFTNVSLTNSKMATVTIVGIASGSSVAMGRTYTINGGSNKGITWATTSVPNFDTTNWSILTFRFINDDVGVSSVFANKN